MKVGLFAAMLCASVTALTLPHAAFAQAQESSADEERMNAAAKVVQAALNDIRAGDFESWIARYDPNAVLVTDQFVLNNRAEIARVYRGLFDAGIPAPDILESGWTGESIFIVQREYFPDGTAAGRSYAEYTVQRGRIIAVHGRVLG